jgi:hypothetical protein
MNYLNFTTYLFFIVSLIVSVFTSTGYARTVDPLIPNTIDNKVNTNLPFVFDYSLSIADLFTMISSLTALVTVVILLYNYKKQNALFNSQIKHYEEILS